MKGESIDKTVSSRTAETSMSENTITRSCRSWAGGDSVAWLRGNWRMWRPIIPLLAKKFTVIAPLICRALANTVDSENGIDMKTSATRIRTLVRSLGVEKARVVGHDIGLMVAYAYAAQFPAETEKLALMDAFLPGVPGWEPIYNNPNIWHFRFNGEYPEKLVKGTLTSPTLRMTGTSSALIRPLDSGSDRKSVSEAYSRPGRMHAGVELIRFVSPIWPGISRSFHKRS